MGILDNTVFIARDGTFKGMPTFMESGYATDDITTRNELSEYESGRVTIRALPRQRGLVAKSLDSRTIKLATLSSPSTMSGPHDADQEVPNCLQLGNTTMVQVAPKQPATCANANKAIIQWTRQYVQLLDDPN